LEGKEIYWQTSGGMHREITKWLVAAYRLFEKFETELHSVIACDKREAFAQGSACDEAIQLSLVTLQESWIASLRSQ
jgi:hypothetical protein